MRGIHWWPVDSPHKGPVTEKKFPFDDVIMSGSFASNPLFNQWQYNYVHAMQFDIWNSSSLLQYWDHLSMYRRMPIIKKIKSWNCLISKLGIPVSGKTASTHWGWDKMATIFQTTFSNTFSLMKIVVFWWKFNWNLFPRVQLTIFEYWIR